MRFRVVVGAGSDVVRALRMEERREVLDLPPARAELEHPAAVELDPVLLAVVVEAEELGRASCRERV